jgi:HD-GYP domain-containing protein (c-di-GMP phosphodiesterase class II)
VGRLRTVFAALLALAAGLVPLALVLTVGTQAVEVTGTFHASVVGASALAATGAAFALTAMGVRRDDARAVMAGMAFSTMAGLLAVHGLATPGELLGPNTLVAVTGGLTLPVGAAILALAAYAPKRRPARLRPLLVLQFVLLAAVLGLSTLGALQPQLLPRVPAAGSTEALVLLGLGATFLLAIAFRAWRTYLLTHRAGDLLVVVGAGWLLAGSVAALTQEYWQLGWWIGHGIELGAIALIGAPVALDLRRPAPSRPLIGDLRALELVRSAEGFLDAELRGLLARLHEKDENTELHTRDVARLTVQVGEQLGLPAARLRTLAIGALVHDVGKLAVPDAILKKPAPLDEDEFREIKRHPRNGHDLLGRLGGFSSTVRRLVLDHHERLDGRGYPRGLAGEAIDLDTRILTVCDVFSALTTDRVYRPARSAARALEMMREELGTAFDPACVAALERVVGLEAAPQAAAA